MTLNLPELPPHDETVECGSGDVRVWEERSMRAYATAAVLAERARCAKVLEDRAAMYRAKADKAGPGDPMHDRSDGYLLCAEASEWGASAIRGSSPASQDEG